mmetsp:Transcript_13482/g.11549  ORF Transcript_13482/g.11549 Transcript_13482/m.11549 type:complete len:132 (-) Transcript_13482:589-984(-)
MGLILWVAECLPSMLCFILVSIFAYFWQEIYESFGDSLEDVAMRIQSLKKSLIGLNVILFSLFGFSSIMFLLNLNGYDSNLWFSTSAGITTIACFLGALLICYHGSRLYNRTKSLVQYMGRGFKSVRNFKY